MNQTEKTAIDPVYEYKGKHYSEEDLSIEDDRWAGTLYDLFCELEKDGFTGKTDPEYYAGNVPEGRFYESEEDVIKHEAASLPIRFLWEETKDEEL